MCRVLIVPSLTLDCCQASMRWRGFHWCSPSLGHPPGPQTLRLSDSMEQFLDWGQTSPWSPAITLLGVASCLRISFALIRSLRHLLWAYVFPRIWPVDLVKTYGKWVDTYLQKRCHWSTKKCNNSYICKFDIPTRWAVVTGCTGGIGRAYVLAMAAKGMDIVLVI